MELERGGVRGRRRRRERKEILAKTWAEKFAWKWVLANWLKIWYESRDDFQETLFILYYPWGNLSRCNSDAFLMPESSEVDTLHQLTDLVWIQSRSRASKQPFLFSRAGLPFEGQEARRGITFFLSGISFDYTHTIQSFLRAVSRPEKMREWVG